MSSRLAFEIARTVCKEPGAVERIVEVAKVVGTLAGAATAVFAVPVAFIRAREELRPKDEDAKT